MSELLVTWNGQATTIRTVGHDEACLLAARDHAFLVGTILETSLPPLARHGLRLIDRAIVKASREMRGVG